jgi:phage terminase small subunit
VKKYKVSDKTAALTNAMKYLGLLRDKVEHTFPEGGIGVTVEFVDTQPEGKESGSSSD